MQFFLSVKAWQLFVVFITPFILGFLVMPMATSSEGIQTAIKFFGVINFLWALIAFGWIFSIGVAANRGLNNELKRNDRVFKFGLLYALIYIFVFSQLMTRATPASFGLIVPFHLLAMAASFYGLWFASRQLVVLKEGRSVRFMDFSGPFFLMWFFPIGVWFVQPLVNELLGKSNET